MNRLSIQWQPTRRDELISLARYGQVTPDEAEAKAKAAGQKPFAWQPEYPAFDPMLQSRWTIVMAIAWIASRERECVRLHSEGFTSEATFWAFREWNEPVENGTAFARRAGWFLESWRERTTVLLSLTEKILRAERGVRWQMPVREAERALWRELSEGRLVAEALNDDGRPVDIPTREWSYLKLFEEGKRDVIKYEALDHRVPFTKVKLKRDDLVRIWPAMVTESATIKSETACYRWLAHQVTLSPDFRPKPKAAFWTEAEEKFRPLGKRQFDRAWEKALSETDAHKWRKAGRPRRKSNHHTG